MLGVGSSWDDLFDHFRRPQPIDLNLDLLGNTHLDHESRVKKLRLVSKHRIKRLPLWELKGLTKALWVCGIPYASQNSNLQLTVKTLQVGSSFDLCFELLVIYIYIYKYIGVHWIEGSISKPGVVVFLTN